jgi:tetratricopeptide (TPR) repeat protein
MGQERWQQSVDAFLQEIQLDTMNAMAWANLGDAYLHWDHASDAIRPLTRATQLDSLAPNYPYLLGEAYMRLQNARLAVQAFGEALRRSPDNPLALFNRGLAYRALGDWDSARADLRRVAQAPPGSVAEDIQARARNSLAQMPPH